MRNLSAVMIVVLVAVMIGCVQRKDSEITPAPGVYPAPDDIKFSVKVTPQKFTLGEAVALEASLFNGGRDVFQKEFGSACTWDYEIASEDGRVLGPSRMCATAITELRLEPGELRMIMRNWRGKDVYFDAGDPLPPGRYSVTAGFVDEYARVVPMAEPVWIEIVAPKR